MKTELIKGLSLWQPWASLIAIETKQIETRSWGTNYRDPLVIHAAKKFHAPEMLTCFTSPFREALQPHGLISSATFNDFRDCHLPLGAILAVADLVDCVPTESLTSISKQERAFGDYSPGRYGWILENIRPLKEPFPYRGGQQLFNVPAMLVFEHNLVEKAAK